MHASFFVWISFLLLASFILRLVLSIHIFLVLNRRRSMVRSVTFCVLWTLLPAALYFASTPTRRPDMGGCHLDQRHPVNLRDELDARGRNFSSDIPFDCPLALILYDHSFWSFQLELRLGRYSFARFVRAIPERVLFCCLAPGKLKLPRAFVATARWHHGAGNLANVTKGRRRRERPKRNDNYNRHTETTREAYLFQLNIAIAKDI